MCWTDQPKGMEQRKGKSCFDFLLVFHWSHIQCQVCLIGVHFRVELCHCSAVLLLSIRSQLRQDRLLLSAAADAFYSWLVGDYSECSSSTACMWLPFLFALIHWLKITGQIWSSFLNDQTINRCPWIRAIDGKYCSCSSPHFNWMSVLTIN